MVSNDFKMLSTLRKPGIWVFTQLNVRWSGLPEDEAVQLPHVNIPFTTRDPSCEQDQIPRGAHPEWSEMVCPHWLHMWKGSLYPRLHQRTLPPSSKNLRAKAFIQLEIPILEYASRTWDPLPKTLSDKVEAAQRRAARAVYNVPRTSRISTTTLLSKLDWVPLAERREHRRICLFRAMHFKEVNTELHDYIKPSKTKTSSRKHSVQYSNTHHNTKSHLISASLCHTAKLWNNLDVDSRGLYPRARKPNSPPNPGPRDGYF